MGSKKGKSRQAGIHNSLGLAMLAKRVGKGGSMIYVEVWVLAASCTPRTERFGGWTFPPDDKRSDELMKLIVPKNRVKLIGNGVVEVTEGE